MHTHQSSLIRAAAKLAALFVTAALLVLTSLVCVASANAADGSQYSLGKYGQAASFGSFDSIWYDGGAYNGSPQETAPKPGQFLNPTGFAVDPSAVGGTAVYVLDRVSAASEQTTETGTRWRLQKLTAQGVPVARTEFFLPKTGVRINSTQKSTVEPIGLAISGGNIYTVIAGRVGEPGETIQFAQEIVGWSTTPNGEVLPAAPGSTDTVSSAVTADGVTYAKPNVISGQSELESTLIFNVRGLTADGNGSLAVLGDATESLEESEPALVEQVSIATGQETAGWLSSSFGLATAQAESISTNPVNGNIDALLNGGTSKKWDLVELSPSLTSPVLQESEGQEPSNLYQAPFGLLYSFERPAGSHGVVLTNGLFATAATHSPSPYWASQDAIRLISPFAEGKLSSSTGPDTVYDTLGKAASGACDLTAGGSAAGLGDVVLAAGSTGSLWSLNVGKDVGATHVGRVVTEFAPNAAAPCVTPPAGTTFSLTDETNAPSTHHLASAGPLTVSVGSHVLFGTEPFEYPFAPGAGTPSSTPAAVFAFEWDPIGGGAHDTGYTLVDKNATGALNAWPPGKLSQFATTEEFQYTEPGTYTVKMKALGELGEYDASGTVIVDPISPPTAAFTLASTAQVNQGVSLDASGSHPSGAAHIVNYRWEFGDGAEDETSSAQDSHAYTTPGTYTVTLTVRDNDNQVSTAVTHQITVTAAPPSSGTGTGTGAGNSTGGGSSSGGGSTGTAPGGTTKKPPTGKPAPSPKQKLAAALKQCKKKKPGKARKACEKQAQTRYGGQKSKK